MSSNYSLNLLQKKNFLNPEVASLIIDGGTGAPTGASPTPLKYYETAVTSGACTGGFIGTATINVTRIGNSVNLFFDGIPQTVAAANSTIVCPTLAARMSPLVTMTITGIAGNNNAAAAGISAQIGSNGVITFGASTTGALTAFTNSATLAIYPFGATYYST